MAVEMINPTKLNDHQNRMLYTFLHECELQGKKNFETNTIYAVKMDRVIHQFQLTHSLSRVNFRYQVSEVLSGGYYDCVARVLGTLKYKKELDKLTYQPYYTAQKISGMWGRDDHTEHAHESSSSSMSRVSR